MNLAAPFARNQLKRVQYFHCMNPPPFNVRRIDLKKDLGQAADLIDRCFGEFMDPDGQRYINFLRNLAKDQHSLLHVLNDPLRTFSPLDGFVCHVNERLVGNISTSSFVKGQERICFLSNVAVHPEYRLQGIAGSLVREAEKYAKKSGFSLAWLQVRKDNEIARHVYESLGYKEKAVRTTWVSGNFPLYDPAKKRELMIKPRRALDWQNQKAWLMANYPDTVTWQLEMRLVEFTPKILQSLSNTLTGRRYQHMSIWQDRHLKGVITWQSSFRFADPLWLAIPQDRLASLVKNVIPYMKNYLMTRKPLMVNIDNGAAEQEFIQIGFEKLHTLIWMNKEL